MKLKEPGKLHRWQGNGGLYKNQKYSLYRLATIANTNSATFQKMLTEHNDCIDSTMSFFLNRPTYGKCLWCGKRFKYKKGDIARRRHNCSEVCMYHIRKAMISNGEIKPDRCGTCVICGGKFPRYIKLPFSLRKKTCDDPNCIYENKYKHKRIKYNGKYYLKKELVELRNTTAVTLQKRINLMGLDRAMSDEPTPMQDGNPPPRSQKKKKVDPENTVLARDRNTKCRKTNFDSGKRETCVKYGDCWNEDDKVICSGLEIGNIVDGVPQLGNVGTVITRGCGDFGAIKGI